MSHIILKPKAQFGNILFQYAFDKMISIELGDAPILIDRTFGGKILIDLGLAEELKIHPYSYRILYEHRHIGDKLINFILRQSPLGYTHINQRGNELLQYRRLKSKVAIFGRLQDYELFSGKAAEIRNCIQHAMLKHAEISNFTIKQGQLAVHIRRGDYLQAQYLKSIGALDSQYYMKAIREVLRKHDVKRIVLFTDDPADEDVREVQQEFNCQCQSTNWIDDFIGIMSSEYRIISNSTFSWWAAFLGEAMHPEKIFAPSPFMRASSEVHEKILPPTWSTIPATWVEVER